MKGQERQMQKRNVHALRIKMQNTDWEKKLQF